MSEHDQHHQHRKEEHEHERKEKKHEEHKREEHADSDKPLIYPKWILIIGLVLTLTAVLVWTFLL
jgi:hypothetical protein